ncbi:MAG: P-loop NTPase [Elusimicrobia bacterium]|nr:P-loop NTPase [Elusimicrobiota bacterium]
MKKIAIASGKGGTGKTTLSLMLSQLLSKDKKVRLLDSDVENPDCHLLLDVVEQKSREINVFKPLIDLEKCTFCGKCQEVCEFNCLLVMPKDVMYFKELCHPCRGCLLVCPEGAISEGERKVGYLHTGKINENFYFDYAIMDVGEARANPLIEELKEGIVGDEDYVIIDAPPGANCPMVEAVRDSDYTVLVTEPTPFGLYDLKIAVGVLGELGLKCGIVINRSEEDDGIIEDYAESAGLEIIAKIPFSREFASLYSKGIIEENFFPGLADDLLEFFS